MNHINQLHRGLLNGLPLLYVVWIILKIALLCTMYIILYKILAIKALLCHHREHIPSMNEGYVFVYNCI